MHLALLPFIALHRLILSLRKSGALAVLTALALTALSSIPAHAAPANDDFANATTLTMVNDTATGSVYNADATKEAGEPSHAGNSGGRSVWWKWTALSAGAVSVSTANSNFDTVLGVYTGSNVSALATIASNDDDPSAYFGYFTSGVTFNVTAGTTYYVAVDGKNAAIGTISLAISFLQPVAPTISTNPASYTTASVGQQVSIGAFAFGTPSPTYHWQRLPAGGGTWIDFASDGIYSGIETNSLAIPQVTLAMNGDQFRCVATNIAGTATTSATTLLISPAIAPTVTNMPASILAIQGDTLSIQPPITGTSPLTYQWRKDGVDIPGAISGNYFKTNITLADGGSYTLTVTNAAGSVTSAATIVAVGPAVVPVIQTPAGVVTLAYGNSLNLSLAVGGSQPITFQWKKDGVDIPGATSGSYNKSNVTLADSGVYSVTATNAAGSASGSIATVTVNPAVVPTITNLPTTITQDYGTSLSLFANVTGTPSITYQWRKDGIIIGGATSSNYTKGNLTPADNGTYSLTATNLAGSTTASVSLVVNPATAPTISNLPTGIGQPYGGTISISATISGTSPITYQWKKDGVNIPGATSQSYNKNNVTAADNGVYTLTATNAIGSVTSTGVPVTVGNPVAPLITNMPASTNVSYGNSFSLSPNVYGTQPLTYQWKKDGVDISGATSNSYFKSNVTPADNGAYTLIATNTAGNYTSSPAIITVAAPVAPSFSNVPASVLVDYGSSIGLNFGINGTSPMSYQWKKDGAILAGATSSSYFKSGASSADSGVYTLTVTNAAGSATTPDIAVTVNPPVAPVISGLPAGVTIAYGASLNLSPSITGTSPMTYQWKKDGTNIPGAISAQYFKSSVGSEDSGVYTLVVTNLVGATTSSAVGVTVGIPTPPVIIDPAPVAPLPYGSSLSISPTTAGSLPQTYVWKKDGVVIPGATGSSYFRGSLTPADSGVYTLTATNVAGSATSSGITIVVNPAVAPTISGLPANISVGYKQSFGINPTVSGTQPLTFQWKKNGVPVPDASPSSSFNRSAALPEDSGTYTLTATNVAGTAVSSPVVVVVTAAVVPGISNLPATLQVNYGDTLSLSPTYTGTTPMAYQWSKNGAEIPGANSATFTKQLTTLADAGTYSVAATNAAGTVASSNVVVTIAAPVLPIISNLPLSSSVNYGQTLSLSPTVNGSQPRAYQWQKDGVDLPGAVAQNYSKGSATPADSGVYTLTVTNAAGSVTSAGVTLTVNAAVAPIFSDLPAAMVREYGEFLGISPTVIGTQPMTFQWKKNGVAISNGTSSSLSLNSVTPADSGTYTLTATNVAGTTVSSALVLTVNAAVLPTITRQPVPVVVVAGAMASFSVSATGTNPLSYQWYFNGNAIPSINGNLLTLQNVQAGSAGNYTVAVTGPGGTVTSNVASLTLASPLGVVGVAASNSHSLFIKSDGTLWGMGTSYYGALGTADQGLRYHPARIATDVIAAVAGNSFSLFLKSDGSLWATGFNPEGQLGDGTFTDRRSPVQVATAVVAVAAGDSHSLFLKSDGSLWAMGYNSSGQLGGGAIGHRYLPIPVATDVASISAGSSHSLFVKSDGSLWAMGANSSGQLGDGSNSNRFTPVPVATGVASAYAGNSHSLFIKSDGSLWAMGANFSGQLGDGTNTNRNTPVQIATGVVTASAGYSHSAFIKSDGSLWTMGDNGFRQLGDNTNTSRNTPIQVATNAWAVCASSQFTLLIKTDGSLTGVGSNNSAQLGIGSTSSASTWTDIASGPVSAPVAPATVTATDGTLLANVRISWSPTLATTFWEVWRSATNDPNTATRIAGNLTQSIYYDSSASSGSVYYYWIRAVNPAGTSALGGPDSGFAIPLQAPQITQQPASRVAVLGQSVTFTVAATGNPAPTYQWKKNGVNLPGATGTSYTVVSFNGTTDVAAYTVVVTNSQGSVTSNPATLAQVAPGGSDFNGDGHADLFWSNTVTGERSVWFMNGSMSSGGMALGSVPPEWKVSGVADFNADGSADILWTNTLTGDRAMWLMNGTNVSQNAFVGNVPVQWEVSATADFNGDGKADILWTNTVNGDRAVWLMNGSTMGLGSAYLATIPPEWEVSGTGDFDGDGKADIFWTNTTTGERSMWFMNGSAMSGGMSLGLVPTAWAIGGIADFNGDGKADVLLTNTATGECAMWLMNGSSITSNAFVGTLTTQWVVSDTADYDGDGKADILWTNTATGDRAVWLMNGSSIGGSSAYLATVPVAWEPFRNR